MNSQYYEDRRVCVRALAGQFPDGYCLLISTNPRNNGAVECTLDNAARLLVEGTHRLASPEEAKAYRESQNAARARSAPAMTLNEARRAFLATMKERKNAVK